MFHASLCTELSRFRRKFNLLKSAIPVTPRHLATKPFKALGVQGYVIQQEKPTRGGSGRDVAFEEGCAAAQQDHGHSPVVQAALLDGGKEAGSTP